MHAGIEAYYTEKVLTYGATPAGVDWRCTADQELRFAQLLAVCDFSRPFSLNDLGCGYAALRGYLANHHAATDVDYLGIDLSGEMIARAKRLWPPSHPGVNYVIGQVSPRVGDYSVASGIFNVKLDQRIDRWERFVARTLLDLHATSRLGFGVNFIARDPSRPPPEELYCTSPEPWIAFCQRELKASVEVRAGYGMREFTLLVRRA